MVRVNRLNSKDIKKLKGTYLESWEKPVQDIQKPKSLMLCVVF